MLDNLNFKIDKNDYYLPLKKVLLGKKNDRNNISLLLENNTNKTLTSFSIRIIQKDSKGNYLGVTDFTYSDFVCNPYKDFIPKINLNLLNNTSRIDYIVTNIIYNEKSLTIDDGSILEKKKKYITIQKKFIFLSIFILAIIFSIIMYSLNYYYMQNIDFLTDGTLKYEIVSGNLEIIEFYGNEKDVVIPSTYNDYAITAIDDEVFKDSAIQSVIIDSRSISIGEEAFKNCSNLVSVTGNNVTLSESSFSTCSSLTTIDFDINGAIPKNCFENCISLVSFYSETATSVESNGFYNCTSLEEVILPNAMLYKNSFFLCSNISSLEYNTLATSATLANVLSVSSINSISNYESSIYISYFNNIDVEELHLLNENVDVKESLEDLKLTNYVIDIENGIEYLDDLPVIYALSSDILEINDKKILSNPNLFKNYDISTINVNISCNISSSFIDSLSYLSTININSSNVVISSKLNSNITVNINTTTTSLSSILEDNVSAKIYINTDILSGFFDGVVQNEIYISNDVSSISSNAFNDDTNIEKLIVSDSSIFKGAITGVYELDIDDITTVLPANNIKKLVVSSSINDKTLANCTEIKELIINTNLNNSYLGSLFNTTNSNIPSSLESIYLTFDSVPSSYFNNLIYVKNIAITNTNKITDSNVFDGCSSLYNIYLSSPNTKKDSLYSNLNTLASENDHKINVLFGSSTNYSTYSNLSFTQNVSLSKTYNIIYNNKTYTYEELFLTDLNHLLNISDDYVIRLYSSSNYTSSNLVNCYSKSSNIYCITKQYITYNCYEKTISVSYYDKDNSLLKTDKYTSNTTLSYYYPTEVEGYYFVGWYSDISRTNKFDFSDSIDKSIKLYAKYVADSSYISDNQKVITINSSSFSSTSKIYNDKTYLYYKTYKFYAPTDGIINIMTIGDSDTYIVVSNNYDDDSGIDLNASLALSISSGTYQISIYSLSKDSTTVIFTYEANAEVYVNMSLDENILYSFSALPGEEYSIDISNFSKDGYTFKGIYTTSGICLFDEFGNSTNYWLSYSDSETNFVVIYE